MGYIKHHAIVVTSSGLYIENAHKKAKKIFGKTVSKIIKSGVNGYESFFIAPDGSKEGWDESDKGNERRDEFINWIKSKDGRYVSYAELFYGEDNGRCLIERHN